MSRPTFLDLVERSSKPRRQGLTHVIDGGSSVDALTGALSAAAGHIDIWKFGWGTAYLDDHLTEKLHRLRAADVISCLGGTLLEIAWAQGRATEFFDWASQCGLDAIEVSRGLVPMTVGEKTALIKAAATRFVVLSEVGNKDPLAEIPAASWADEAQRDIAAGARWVVIEGRESGNVGLYHGDGRVREDIVEALTDAVGLNPVIFEAPRKEQQSWFIRHFGPEVSLGNVARDSVLGVETLRRGLRADTWRPSEARAGTA